MRHMYWLRSFYHRAATRHVENVKNGWQAFFPPLPDMMWVWGGRTAHANHDRTHPLMLYL